MDEMGITELELERQFLFGMYRKHMHISKNSYNATQCAPTREFKPADREENITAKPSNAITLNSPMVGVIYLSSEPGSKPFISIGSKIKTGDTVALVEAMKTFNPVKADKDGVVKEILVKDSDAVEFDQPLIVIE